MSAAIALGWCEWGEPPEGIRAEPMGGLRLLTTDAATPADILARQQACFDAGMDLLPTHPALACPADRARRLPVPALHRRLHALRGRAQMVLHLGWPATPPPRSGRDHLAALRAQAEASRAARIWLETLGAGLRLPTAPVEVRSNALLLHLLVPRATPPGLTEISRQAVALPEPAPHLRLTLCGPWPPLAFADLPPFAEPPR